MVGMLFSVVAAFSGRVLWALHPWVPSGQSCHISDQDLEGYEVEVWQRKNSTIVEPFTTGLFIHKTGAQWRAFWIGFEDVYHPNIRVRKQGSQLVVIFDGKTIGIIDHDANVFKRTSDGSEFPAAVLKDRPPGQWWFKDQ
jgi:hypothetical protein